jgi:hypothetical protein
VHWEVMFPISSGSMGFISARPLNQWFSWGVRALVTLVITSRFLLDSHPFLLEAIAASSSSSLPFQMHMRLSWKFFPSIAITYLSPLGQLIERGANWLQKFISKTLYDHFSTSFLTCLLIHIECTWGLVQG